MIEIGKRTNNFKWVLISVRVRCRSSEPGNLRQETEGILKSPRTKIRSLPFIFLDTERIAVK